MTTSVASFLKSKPAENIYFGDAFSLDGKIKKYRALHQSAFAQFDLAYQLMSVFIL